ncbi:hypothetical protein [Microcoleus phage My-WqHQDG]|nr:hypothetical protein [Microcoleus phage My-WqHQDG]
MRIIEQDYVQANLPTMEAYLDILMHDTGITGEELASVLECPVEQLYELLTGVRTITPADIAALEKAYADASHQAFVVGCQMMTAIQNIG